MYLAPLNYERYFKKVFSETKIAKRFLEDFLDIQIQELEVLPTKHKITNESTIVEFDFRCKIDNQYVIIDMQQWFKPDIIPRFYLYHAMSSVLQLEQMPEKNVAVKEDRQREVKDYSKLLPVITLIWLADDNLNFSEDFIAYTISAENITELIYNDHYWTDFEQVRKEREKCLTIMNNSTKNLDFLSKNRLIYAFQKNIVKNKKYSKYLSWFELAEKTRNKLNEKAWFDEYLKDEIFVEIIKRINTNSLPDYDLEYVDFCELFEANKDSFIQEGKEEEKRETAIKAIKAGLSNEIIKTITDLSDSQIEKLRKVF